MNDRTDSPAPPLALLAELTHRCPLACPYCSNPVALEAAADELDTDAWRHVLSQAADMGVLQVHFSGGEPGLRRDLAGLVAHARDVGLYSNLITSGVALSRARLDALVEAGLDHVQLSFQDVIADVAERIGHLPGAQDKKLAFAGWVREAGLPLTVNAVVNRHNIARVGAMIDLALTLDAGRVEIAHVQYYGWALRNMAALIPTAAELDRATATVEAARRQFAGRLLIDYVIPDYYARQPKACMGGWGRQFLNVTPSGKVLPCHAAETISGLAFETVRDRPLAAIWTDSPAFQRFRGTAWMPEPCRSCDQREVDRGGCRCQALALAGDAAATDPVCGRSPLHRDIVRRAEAAAASPAPAFVYRG